MKKLFFVSLMAFMALVCSCNHGETVKGEIIFGHEVRAFRPEGSEEMFWLVDKSGYLMERYRESGQPEWSVKAELEVRDLGKATDGFAEDYDSTFQVLRIIKIEE